MEMVMVRGRLGNGGGGGAWVGPEFEWYRPCRVKYSSSVKRRVKLYDMGSRMLRQENA